MWVLDLITGRRQKRDAISKIAAKVAQDAHEAVWSRVSHRVLAMRLNEARGYVRARAAQCIHAEVERVVRRNPLFQAQMQSEIASRAIDHVVGLVIRDVLVMPAQKAARRRAA